MPSSAAIEPEWSLLLAACSVAPRQQKLNRIRLLLRQTIRWPELFELADQHGVTMLLHEALSDVPEAMPTHELHGLQRRYRTNVHKTLFFARELIRILDRLDALAIEVMPYKGVTLAEALYADMALRQSGDIDLLIHARDFPRIREAVAKLGYAPHLPLSPREESAYLKSGYEYTFDHAAGRNLLELQWALQPRYYSVDMDMDALFRRGIQVTIAGRRIKTLSSEDMLLVLALHGAKHLWGRLIWLCDIAQLATQRNLNWKWIAEQAAALGILRILKVTLLLSSRLLGAEIPQALQATLAADPIALALADEMNAHIATEHACNTESFSYFRQMLRMREQRSDQVRFVRRLAFTPGPGEWKAVRLPPALFPLYRLVRLSRLAARLARA
jgi:hypothetical protein